MASLRVPSFLFTNTGAAAWGLLEGLIIPAFNNSSISLVSHCLLWKSRLRTPSLMGRLCFGYNLHLTRGVMVADFSSLKMIFGNLTRRAFLFSSNIWLDFLCCMGWTRYTSGLDVSFSTTSSVQKHSKVFTCSSWPYSTIVLYR